MARVGVVVPVLVVPGVTAMMLMTGWAPVATMRSLLLRSLAHFLFRMERIPRLSGLLLVIIVPVSVVPVAVAVVAVSVHWLDP